MNKRSAHFRIVMRQIWALLLLSVTAAAILLILGGWSPSSASRSPWVPLSRLRLIMGSIDRDGQDRQKGRSSG
ncbi:MAG: hypothetical protein IPK32_16825 [Verrucomicrobiaceae bacterium]|nr:hypothetical protein [Verrucomicrobiaceae bacterium]